MAAVTELERPQIPVAPPTPEPTRVENGTDADRLEQQQEALQGVLQQAPSQTVPTPVTNKDTGEALLTPVGADVPEIVLPESEEQAKEDIKLSASESKHWFGAWVLRMIDKAKKVGAKIIYKNSKS